MCSTRATWRPARRIATSPCCWSMRASGILTQTRRHACILSLLGIAQGRARRQQDGSRRFRPGALRGDRRGVCRLRRRNSASTQVTAIPVSALKGDNVVAPERAYALVSRADAARASGDGGCRRRDRRAAVPLSGAMGEPAASRFPRLCRDGRRAARSIAWRGGGDPSFGQARACGAHRHRRRRPRGGASRAMR